MQHKHNTQRTLSVHPVLINSAETPHVSVNICSYVFLETFFTEIFASDFVFVKIPQETAVLHLFSSFDTLCSRECLLCCIFSTDILQKGACVVDKWRKNKEKKKKENKLIAQPVIGEGTKSLKSSPQILQYCVQWQCITVPKWLLSFIPPLKF